MPVARLTLELEIPHAQSLKDRRQVVRSMKDRLRGSFNVSFAEMDDALVWNRATIEVVAVSRSVRYLAGQMAAIERAATAVANRTGAQIVDIFAEVLSEGDAEMLELTDIRENDDESSVSALENSDIVTSTGRPSNA